MSGRPRVLLAPDKFKGTASARVVASAMADGGEAAHWDVVVAPMADGGEGTLDAFGGANRTSPAHDARGRRIEVPWRLDGVRAVVEVALAVGLQGAGGAEGNDPLAASTFGVGELLRAAFEAGARRVLVGVGGTASTDGGRGALEALGVTGIPDDVIVVVGCDVATPFLDAAARFGPQKGATPDDVAHLTARLRSLRAEYEGRLTGCVDQPGAGAGGGLAGGLASLGASLVSGFDLVADAVGLDDLLVGVDLVLTGEGRLDASSFEGKVVGGIARRATAHGRPVVAIVGDVVDGSDPSFPVHSLVQEFGRANAVHLVEQCVRAVTSSALLARFPADAGVSTAGPAIGSDAWTSSSPTSSSSSRRRSEGSPRRR